MGQQANDSTVKAQDMYRPQQTSFEAVGVKSTQVKTQQVSKGRRAQGTSVELMPVRFLLTLLAGLIAGTEMCWNKLFAGFQRPCFP